MFVAKEPLRGSCPDGPAHNVLTAVHRWVAGRGATAARPTAKERILLHLLEFAKHGEAVEVPRGMTQEAVARAASVDVRHLTQYVRPLEKEELVRERTAHVQGGRQRRKVYSLTESGRMAAIRLRETVKSDVVRLRDAKGIREATVAQVLEMVAGKVSVLDIVRESIEAGIVDLAALVPASGAGFVEMLAEAPRVQTFVGRRTELAAVTGDGGGPRTIVVRGMAGIGKSSFAAKACEILRGTRNLYWHRVRPWDTRRSLLAGLGDFLSAVGRPGLRSLLAHGEESSADAVLREDLNGTRSLLVFDDAHEATPEVVSFLRFLKDGVADAADVRVLVLTRRALPFYDRRDVTIRGLVREIDLAGLGAEEIAVFATPHANERDLVALGRQLGGHPLFLELVRSSDHPASGGHPLRDVQRFIEEEIYGALSDPERRMMKVASLYRVPVPREALFADPGLSHDVLVSLEGRALVRSVGEDAFGVHDTVRDFFVSVLTPSEREGLSRFAIEQLRRLAAKAQDAGNYVASIDDLSNALQLAASDEEKATLLEALGDATERIGDLPRTLIAYREAQRARTAPEGLARLHRKAASALQVRGENASARKEIGGGLAALGEIPSVERGWLDLVRCRVATKLEEWEEARESGAAALGAFRLHGDLRGQAEALLEMGNIEIESQTSHPADAERYLKDALASSESLRDPEFAARVHIALAHLFANRYGDVERAMEQIAATEALENALADPHVQRSFLMLKAWFNLELQADYPVAEDHFTQAVALARKIHSPAVLAFAKYGLAFVKYFQRRIDDARKDFEALAVEFQALGFPSYVAESLWKVAECCLWQGDLQGFNGIVSAFGDPKFARGAEARPVQAKVLLGLDRTIKGDPAGCDAAFANALRLAEAGSALEEAWLVHFVHSFFGIALRAQGRDREAADHIRQAVEFLEKYRLRARLSIFRDAERQFAAFLTRASIAS